MPARVPCSGAAPLLGYSRGLRIMGETLVILDYIGDGHDFNIILIDPKDGSQDQVIFPVCNSDNSWEENLDDNSGVLFMTAPRRSYLVFGTSFGCIQRYDLGTGRLVWENRSEEFLELLLRL